MTATIRKQIQRSRLAHSGGKRLDLYLTKDEHEALDAFRMALNLPSLTDAVKALIEPFLLSPGEPFQTDQVFTAMIDAILAQSQEGKHP